MKHKKISKSKRERKKDKKKHRKQEKRSESSSSSSGSEVEEEWVERPVTKCVSIEQNTSSSLKKQEPCKREDWMNVKSIFPCVFNEKKSVSLPLDKNIDKPDLDKLGQSDRELNPYWKNGGNGLPGTDSIEADMEPVMDANWLKKSLQRAQEQAEKEGKSLEEIAANRWGSLEVIRSMIFKAERMSERNKSENIMHNNKKSIFGNQSLVNEKYESSKQHLYRPVELKRDTRFRSRSRSQERHKRYREHGTSQCEEQRKQKYRKPTDSDCFVDTSYETYYPGTKRWQKDKMSNETKEKQFDLNTLELRTINTESNKLPSALPTLPTSSHSTFSVSLQMSRGNSNTNDTESNQMEPMTEAEMNKLGAKIVKAEIMGNTDLAVKLRDQLQKARELSTKTVQSYETENVENVILTHTDNKGVTRPLESRNQSADSSGNIKQKNLQTHISGKRVRHYFDDDKYSLQQLFQRERGRSTREDDAAFIKVASKNMNMDEIFEEQITCVRSDAKQSDIERSVAIKEHKQLLKSVDSCRWCIDSKYMLKHMIITMDSEICLSLPHYTSLTDGHCILTPIQHVASQLQLDENVWEKLQIYKRILYKMFMDQNKYPVFYEMYRSRHKFPHMQLECIPLPKDIGESAPMYFKKALLECETEWSMNKKVIDLECKNVRQVIPNGLSYFAVEFETNRGYAHVIEDEQMFPKNFAEEIVGGMLDLDYDVWRHPRKENFDQQRKKVLKFLETWKKYDFDVTNHV